MKRRVIVIGLDGATFSLIDPLLEQGKLPSLKDLVNNGIRARLLSTIPYATVPAWPSFMTGKNPGKHGVFDFFTFADGQRRISNSQDIRSLTLWEILSVYGKRSIVMNVPGTFPPARISGVVVSGMLTPTGAAFVSPQGIRAFLDQVTGGYRVNSRSHLSGSRLVEDVYEVTEKQKAGLLALLKHQDWDFAMMMFRATDVIAHHFWEEQDVVRECYQYMDGVVGEIVSALPDATILLISDHGFQGQRKDFHINKWLIDQGYMCIKKGQGTEASRWEEIGRLEGRAELAEIYLQPSRASRALLRLGLTGQKLRKFMPRTWWNALKRSAPRGLRHHIPATADAGYEVDWERTQASGYQLYAMESKAIKVMNLDQASRTRVCAELVDRLAALRDAQTGEPIVRRAYRREELYVGPYVDRAPDVILDLHDGCNITNSFFADDYVTPREHVRGCHHQEGIFVASGNDIESGKELDSPLSLVDVMPTVLHCLGSPVPDDCDGRVLKEVLDADSEVYQRQVLYKAMDWTDHVANGSLPSRDDEQAEIEERLKALGYL
jgi:predicted AlkP superfamily phosphohydrolase/phosphomutase